MGCFVRIALCAAVMSSIACVSGTKPNSAASTYDEEKATSLGITPPEQITMVEADYPELARKARVEGTVVLSVIIEADGTVSLERVLKPHPLLEQSAIDCVRKWRYRPGLLNGKPVRIRATVQVKFHLQT